MKKFVLSTILVCINVAAMSPAVTSISVTGEATQACIGNSDFVLFV